MPRLISFEIALPYCAARETSENFKMKNSCLQVNLHGKPRTTLEIPHQLSVQSLHESYLSLSSSETDSNVFSLVLRCVRDEK